MDEEAKSQIISRADVPLRFFILRILALFVIFILVLDKIPYELIVLYGIIVLAFILNANATIIEVYPDYFKLIRIGLYKNFKREEKYNYRSIKEFEFNKSELNFWLGIASFLIPYRGGRMYVYRLPSIKFKYYEGQETYEITRRFDYSTKDLNKAFELIEKKLNRHTRK